MTRRLPITALAALLLGACSSPPAHFYTLSPVSAAAEAPLAVAVAVGPVSVPSVVNTVQIMVAVGANELRPEDFNRWAAPLADNISRVVAVNLASLLGSPRVSLTIDALGPTPDYTAAIEVQRFESAPGRAATLEAVWTVRRVSDGLARMGRTSVREPAAAGFEALAAAHSRALGRLSEDIAGAVRGFAGATP